MLRRSVPGQKRTLRPRKLPQILVGGSVLRFEDLLVAVSWKFGEADIQGSREPNFLRLWRE